MTPKQSRPVGIAEAEPILTALYEAHGLSILSEKGHALFMATLARVRALPAGEAVSLLTAAAAPPREFQP